MIRDVVRIEVLREVEKIARDRIGVGASRNDYDAGYNAACEAIADELDCLAMLALGPGRPVPPHGSGPDNDPRDPDHSRPGIFALHNCARCDDGKRPCVQGNPNRCEFPHARND